MIQRGSDSRVTMSLDGFLNVAGALCRRSEGQHHLG